LALMKLLDRMDGGILPMANTLIYNLIEVQPAIIAL